MYILLYAMTHVCLDISWAVVTSVFVSLIIPHLQSLTPYVSQGTWLYRTGYVAEDSFEVSLVMRLQMCNTMPW